MARGFENGTWTSLLPITLVVACGPSVATNGSSTETSGATTSPTSTAGAPATSSTTDASATAEAESTSTGATPSSTGGESSAGGYEGFEGACGGSLSDSWVAWQGVRDSVSGSYGFDVEQIKASPAGACLLPICDTTTSFSVVAGQVESRAFESTPVGGTEPRDCGASYLELPGELGTNLDGFAVSSLDDVYSWCCALAEREGGYATSYGDKGYLPGDLAVIIGEDGLLHRCGTQSCGFCGCGDAPQVEITNLELGL